MFLIFWARGDDLLTYDSVTPLKANFMHAKAQTEGELKL